MSDGKPITPDEAAKLTEEEEEILADVIDDLNELIRMTYNPHDPQWFVRLPMEGLFDDELSTEPPDGFILNLAGRVNYLQRELKSRFEAKDAGWALTYNYVDKFIEIRKAN